MKIGLIASQFSLQRFIAFGYLVSQCFVTVSRRARAVFSSGAVYIVLRSLATSFISFDATYFRVLRTIWTIQRWCSVLGKAVPMASLRPESPSAQRIRISSTPRFLRPFRTPSQYLLLSFCARYDRFPKQRMLRVYARSHHRGRKSGSRQ